MRQAVLASGWVFLFVFLKENGDLVNRREINDLTREGWTVGELGGCENGELDKPYPMTGGFLCKNQSCLESLPEPNKLRGAVTRVCVPGKFYELEMTMCFGKSVGLNCAHQFIL